MKRILAFLLFLIVAACGSKNETSESSSAQKPENLFSVLSSEETGITFVNELKENMNNNGLYYEYYYNGGGVAVADFNNDDLVDIYFVNSTTNNALYQNLGNMKFRNISRTANATGGYGFGTGVTVVDINNDGLMDIYYSKSGKIEDVDVRRNELLINKGVSGAGIPTFENQAAQYGLDIPDFTTQATFFDYDKDGDLDMFLLNHGIEVYDENTIEQLISKESDHRGNRLYRNDDGKFRNVTKEAGIINNMIGYGLGVAVADFNNDNWPDVHVGNDFSEKDYLYINNHDGTFRETSLESFGHVSNFSMGNDVADINNDGLMDLMSVDMMAEDNYAQKTSMSGMAPERFNRYVDLDLHHQYMYNALQLNSGVDRSTGNPMFSDIAQIAGVSSTDWSWAPLFFDMDNDGHKDLFISNGIKGDFRNNDFVNYRKKKQAEVVENKRVEPKSYINDILSKMPTREKKNYFYVNNGNLTFEKQEINQEATNSNGAAYADFDNDGDLDVVVNNSAGVSFVYQNNTANSNFLKVKLKGSKENINALGARITLYSKSTEQHIENHFTRGFQSAMADAVHFGLGEDKLVDSIRVVWSDGTEQVMGQVEPNQTVSISYMPLRQFRANETQSQFNFEDITKQTGVNYSHQENDFNDYQKETLLPHKMSQLGPALAVADVNDDGLEDFFIGGAKGQPAALYLQTSSGKFTKKSRLFYADRMHEDVGATFFDADQDGDQDLYIVSGGTEESPNSPYYQDRFYENNGKGSFTKREGAIPMIRTSGLRVAPGDFDNDGDIDLFIGSRVKPGFYGRYSKSYLLENTSGSGKIRFEDVTENKIPDMLEHTMITSSTWADLNKDGQQDLVITNEWGPIEVYINNSGNFTNETEAYGLSEYVGWWNTVAIDDVDNDGDLDIIGGNLGLNYKYKASFDSPFYFYLNDFDNNQVDDIVLGYSEGSQVYPVRGRECSSGQMPFIKEKFKTYNDYGSANISEIYGEALTAGITYKATHFASSLLINENGKFEVSPFENGAQLSSVNKVFVKDFNNDSKPDILLLGNLYGSEVETPRNDASYGVLLAGNGSGAYNQITNQKANLWAGGDVKDAAFIKIGHTTAVLVARNNGMLSILKTE